MAATLEASLGEAMAGKTRAPPAKWRETLSTLAAGSRDAYRGLVYETDGFVGAYYAMTPIEQLLKLLVMLVK